ncbi:MAG: 5-formyltetrahydrofolate cyclo-ligase [Salinibacter sp.]
MTSPPAPKAAWRTQFRKYRRSLSPSAYRARSSLIVHRALTVPDVAHGQVVHVYWPLPNRGEVDTRPLIGSLRERGADVVLPVVTSFDAETPTLEHRRYEGPTALASNRWGIQEPTGTQRVSPTALDLVLVPAVGADRRGHRLGHGSGYYDAFLQSVTCPRIALVYKACVVPSLPEAPHDVPMTTLVTEQAVIDTSS